MLRNISLALLSAAIGFGCGGAQGTDPHDMSAAKHEAAAADADDRSAEHAGQYDPNSSAEPAPCKPKQVCWTARVNPTSQHRAEASTHHEEAAKHRAAAQALRDAEAGACAGIEAEDRDTSPFYFREDIASVQTLKEPADPARGGKSPATRDAGARVVFRAVPGLTSEWLQRSINCHVARGSVVGHDDAAMSYCPVAIKGVRATVASTGDGFAVDVRGDDPATVVEILRRARALTAPR
jgi:hypothetical protein